MLPDKIFVDEKWRAYKTPYDDDNYTKYLRADTVPNQKAAGELVKVLKDILECNSDKYSSPESAIDAIYAIAFYALPEDERPKQTPNIILSQIGLGRALLDKE